MEKLYGRLEAAGFDRDWIKRFVLPDWWDDSMADIPSNMALAQCAIARRTGLTISQLRSDKPLTPARPPTSGRVISPADENR